VNERSVSCQCSGKQLYATTAVTGIAVLHYVAPFIYKLLRYLPRIAYSASQNKVVFVLDTKSIYTHF